MKILVVGNGAREHAICSKLKRSPDVTEVICAPGNPGIATVARIVPLAVTDSAGMVGICREEGITLAVIGPEAALAAGVSDVLRGAGVHVAGPSQVAAQLESSKAFAKEIMVAAGVPTAGYELFTNRVDLESHCKKVGAPLVLKSDGLASGKGVFVITDASQFEAAFENLFGPLKAETVVAEEFLTGTEVSCIFATNGETLVPLAPAHDYKRLGDRDEGPNTGGMGAVCPTPRINEEDLAWITEQVAAPTVAAMAARGTPFQGFLYAGLMVPEMGAHNGRTFTDGIRVLEFNARLGDPECQAILAHLEDGFLELIQWIAGSRTAPPALTWKGGASTCVVIASDGYPEKPVKGDRILGLEHISMIPGLELFHAGTALDSGALVATGGRTLSLVGSGADVAAARSTAYKGVDLVQLRGRRVRRDIGL